MKSILVTGAAGFIGSHMVAKCKADGDVVTGIDWKPLNQWAVKPHIYMVEDVVNAGLPKFDVCYHLAAKARIQNSFDDPESYFHSNITGTFSVLESARKNGGKVVYAGSSTAYDDVSKNFYSTTKHCGEMLCETFVKSFDIDMSIARLFNVYGPRQVESGKYATVLGIWLRQLRNNKPLTVIGDGKQRRDFTYVDDIVRGLQALAEYGRPEIYNLGCGWNYSLIDIAELLSDNIEYITKRPGEAQSTLADFSKTTEHTGWEPRHYLSNYLLKERKECLIFQKQNS